MKLAMVHGVVFKVNRYGFWFPPTIPCDNEDRALKALGQLGEELGFGNEDDYLTALEYDPDEIQKRIARL